jgi:acid phosphatase type 7
MDSCKLTARGRAVVRHFLPVAWLLVGCFSLGCVRSTVQAITPPATVDGLKTGSATPVLKTRSLYLPVVGSGNARPTSSPGTIPESTPTLVHTLTVTPTPATALRYAASADARVQDNTPTTNYGFSPALRARSTDPTYHTYLKFNVAGVTGSVLHARLRLYVSKASKAGGAVYLVGNTYLDSAVPWSESDLTWENAPAIPSTPLSTLGAVALNSWVEFDVTDAVQGDGIFSFAITSGSQNEVNYNSKEADANQPVLVVELTGVPRTTPTVTPTPLSTDDAVLAGAGDIATCDSLGDEITANLLDSIPGTVFTTGDNAYPDGSAADFADCYNPSWGRHRARTLPAPGNHDYHTPGAKGYFDYFGAAAGNPTKGYYSYELGAWHIIVINSNCAEVGGCNVGSPQERWLRADLASHPTLCTLAYWHQPRFSSGSLHGSATSMGAIWQALYDAGADVVVNGHEHNYERFGLQDPNGVADPAHGIREFVVGTGGASQDGYTFGTPLPNSEVINNDTYGVLKLILHPTSYDWEFVPEPGKTFTDGGSESCISPDTP